MHIAIVNDVPMAVEALRRVVCSVPSYEVAWIAEDGEAAVRKCGRDVPDLILMDLMMPRMDGAEATRLIMQQSPCAILVVTATVEGHAGKVFESMGWGALDAVDTPALGTTGSSTGGQALLAKMAMLERLIRQSRIPDTIAQSFATHSTTTLLPMVAIGASTGGPAALARLLAALPKDLYATYAIVQHVDEQFAPGLASWLSQQTGHEVAVINPLDRPTKGRVMLACTNDHLVLSKDLTYQYTREPADYPYRPSVDVFFHSIAQNWPGPIVGALLTGMGSDGAQGLLALRRAGWHTIAQDQATSLLYGMPKAAHKLGAAVEVLPIESIGAAIVRAIESKPTLPKTERSRK